MLWKNGLDQKHKFQLRGNRKLRNLLTIIDNWTQLYFDKEVTVTSTFRAKVGGKKSYHPIGQAVDLRTKDMPDLAITGWICLIAMFNKQGAGMDFDGKFTWLHECKGEPNEHFHLQYKFGEPV